MEKSDYFYFVYAYTFKKDRIREHYNSTLNVVNGFFHFILFPTYSKYTNNNFLKNPLLPYCSCATRSYHIHLSFVFCFILKICVYTNTVIQFSTIVQNPNILLALFTAYTHILFSLLISRLFWLQQQHNIVGINLI